MGSEEQSFAPESADQQIDRASQALPTLPEPASPSPEQQVVQGLRALYAPETREMEDALERGRERLMQGQAAWIASQQQDGRASDSPRALPEQGNAKKPAL